MAADPTTLKVSPNTITQITAIKRNGTAITPITYNGMSGSSYSTFMIGDFLSGDNVTFSSEGYSNLDVTIGTSDIVIFTEGYQTIAFYKHAGVTYEIEDEKARQDIATKQDALTAQTAYSAKGSATKVPQITTNNLGQVTGITEVTISQPTVNNKTITIQKNSTTVDSFTLNQSTDKTINISVPTKTSDLTNDSGYLTSHQSIKTLKTDNTTTQTASSSEAIAGSGTINLHKVSKTGSYNDLLDKPTIPAGTVTSVQVQATSPVQSSTSTSQSTTLNTTISLADAYGDTKNPYGSKTKNYVLAAPVSTNGAPSFRALTKADIPLASETAASSGTTTSLVTTGEKYTWNNKVDKVPSTDNAIAKYDGTTGAIQNTGLIIEDNNDLKIGRYTYNVLHAHTSVTPVETVIHTKIKYASGSYMPVIRIYGYAYGLQSPIELKLAFYIYGGDMGWCGAVSMGAWRPEIFIFKETVDSIDYVSVGLRGSCYFLGFDVDIQFPTSSYNTANISTTGWSVEFNTSSDTHIIPTGTMTDAQLDANNAVCRRIPYKSTLNNLTINGTTYDGTKAVTITTSNTASAVDNILDGSNSGTAITYAPYSSQQSKLSFDTSSTNPSRTDRLNLNGYLYATKLYSGGSEVITGHQDIKTLNTTNTTAQTTSASEDIKGSGTLNLHKVSKTGSYNDLLNKPTIPATNVIPATTTANKVLISTTTSGTAKWSDFSSAGFLKTNSSGVISVDTTTYGTYSKPSGGIPASDLAESYYLASNPNGYTSNAGTVTSVRVQAGTGLASSTSTAQSTTLDTTIGIASGYKLPTTTEWSNKQDKLTAQTAYTSKGSATKVPQITTNTLGQVTGITEVDITQSTVNNSTITIQKNSTTVDSFTLNQSSDKTIDISVPTTAADVGAVSTEDGVTSVVAGATANKINVTKNGSTSTITVNYVANATSATSSSKTSGLYDKYYRAYAGAAISTYGLLMKGANGRLYPLVTPSYSAASTKAVTTIGLRPDFIWLYDGNAAVSAGGVIKADVLYPEYGSTAGNKYLNSTVPTYCDIYLCGDYDATKDLFYLSTTNASGTASTTSFYALVPYNSEPTYSNYFIQGRYYIYLGSSYSTSNYFQLKTQHPLYYYDGTNLIKVDKKVADFAISTHNSDSSAHSTLFSGKQDTLATQTAYSAKGSATKVPQITTNSLGQVTGITEIDITHPTELPSQSGQSGKYLTTNGTTASWGTVSIPTVNNSTITIQKNGTNVDSFTTNAASGKNINITLAKGDVGLGNVDNTTDLNKPISTATQTALDTKQNTISDLGYIRTKVSQIDDKISGIDITDSGDSLPSAANYSVNDTFLNKTDKKLYTVLTPAYQLNSDVTVESPVSVDFSTGIASGFSASSGPGNSGSGVIRLNAGPGWTGQVQYNIHFKLTSLPSGSNYYCLFYLYGTYRFDFLISSTGFYVRYAYSSMGPTSYGDYVELFSYSDWVTNKEYFITINKYSDNSVNTSLRETSYSGNILSQGSTTYNYNTGTEIGYGRRNGYYGSGTSFTIGQIYLADSTGDFLIPDGALTWDSGTTLEDNTQYNDITNEKTIYYNNAIIYEGGSVAVDSSTITLNNSNQIQTVGYKDVRTNNTLKTWTGTRAQYDTIVTKDANTLYNITDDTDTTAAMLELLYPVGAVYIGTMDVCPLATLGIGSWEMQISRFLVEQKTPTEEDRSWYNLYSDGWCEQGGTIQTSAVSGGVSSAVVTFSKPFIDQHYDFNADVVAKSDNTALYLTGLSSRSATSVTMSSKYISGGGFGAAGTVIYRWTCSYYTSITSNLKMWRRIS